MRIVLANWAKIWHGAVKGGGVNGYCQALGLELVKRGHEVISFCSGTARGPAKSEAPDGPRMFVRRHPDWCGVSVYEVVGSPVLAPSRRQFPRPGPETSAPRLEALARDFLAALSPDVVHFQSLEGFSAGCVGAAAASGANVLFSLHNYHPICPQVYLMQGKRIACTNYENGNCCVGCLTRFDSPALEESPVEPVVVDDPALINAPMPGPARDPRTLGLPVVDESVFDQTDPFLRPVLNIPNAEPSSDMPPNAYARRRAAMVAALNQCDRVLGVSSFVTEKFEAMGVDRRRLLTMPIGTRMVELAERSRRAIEPPAPFDDAAPRLVRLVFLGFHNAFKGLDMLADALQMLPAETLGRYHLCIHALGGESIEPRFRRLEARLGRLTWTPGYRYEDIPWLVGGADLGIVPSVWWDNAPQTVFELLACRVPVLGAELGGIPDFVKHGVNGLLFRGNDRHDLARKLESIITHPAMLTRLRANIKPPKSMTAHVRELESLYKVVRLARAGRGGA